MHLTSVIISAVGLSALISLSLWSYLTQVAISRGGQHPPFHVLLAAVSSVIIVGFICIRSLGFGVDTATYVDLFTHYCNGGNLDDRESSFLMATILLNGAMLGLCIPDLIPAAWIVAILTPILAMRTRLRARIFFLVALFTSLIGIELATNALRQGLSSGFMVLALSLSRRQPILALALFLASAMLHYSAGLVLAALLLSHFGWKYFLSIFSVLMVFAVNSLDSEITLPIASEFLYEIKKYSAHESDEVWVRVLAFACIVAALVAPLLSRRQAATSSITFATGPYAVALRLAICCLPFLSLPYFGYRFIYGVYPVLLLMTLISNPDLTSPANRQLGVLCTLNLLILLTWSAGSSYMREVPFI